jgi:hypothetical protein
MFDWFSLINKKKAKKKKKKKIKKIKKKKKKTNLKTWNERPYRGL